MLLGNVQKSRVSTKSQRQTEQIRIMMGKMQTWEIVSLTLEFGDNLYLQ